MKQRIWNDWNFMRFVRLGLGIAILVQAIATGNWGLVVFGLLFTALPVLNIGCCGTAGCATPVKKNSDTTKAISYEEVV